MKSLIKRAAVLVATASLFTVGATGMFASSAQASTGIGNCSATAGNPSGVQLSTTGNKISRAVGYFRCGTASTVQVQLQLVGDDVAYDNAIVNSVGSYNLAANRSQTVYSGWGSCNEDSPGADELYSQVRVRIYFPGNRTYSAWSAWDKGQTVTYNC